MDDNFLYKLYLIFCHFLVNIEMMIQGKDCALVKTVVAVVVVVVVVVVVFFFFFFKFFYGYIM